MPRIKVHGADLYYEEHGGGPETIVFAHGLLWDRRLFAPQIAALQDRYRCIAFDFRGHGESQVTAAGYDMDTLTEDAAELIRLLGCAPCHFAGLSMGGFVAMRLAIRHPELIRSLMLLETSAEPEPEENLARYRFLRFIARWLGIGLVAGPVLKILFGEAFLADPARAEARKEYRRCLIANDRIGIHRAVLGVITRHGIDDQLDRIHRPTLILVGDQDVATVPAKAERMHARIAGSILRVIPGAGHTSTLEEPEAVTRALEEFLAAQRSL